MPVSAGKAGGKSRFFFFRFAPAAQENGKALLQKALSPWEVEFHACKKELLLRIHFIGGMVMRVLRTKEA
jgi:hypothetical protein